MTPPRGSLDAEADALYQAAEREDTEHCPRCGTEWAWDGDSEETRICGGCRADAAAFYHDLREDV